MTPNQFKNLLAFMFIMTNEDAPQAMGRISPDYMIEKFSRYAGVANLRDDDAWNWGMHPGLKAVFDDYLRIWKVDELFGAES